jgi:hypothetical protein
VDVGEGRECNVVKEQRARFGWLSKCGQRGRGELEENRVECDFKKRRSEVARPWKAGVLG